MNKISILFDELIEYSQRQNEPLFQELKEELLRTSTIGQETIVLIKTLEILKGMKKNVAYFIREIRGRMKSNKKIQKPPKNAILKEKKAREEMGFDTK